MAHRSCPRVVGRICFGCCRYDMSSVPVFDELTLKMSFSDAILSWFFCVFLDPRALESISFGSKAVNS